MFEIQMFCHLILFNTASTSTASFSSIKFLLSNIKSSEWLICFGLGIKLVNLKFK